MAPEVLVAGALHLDVVVDAPRLPALDETLMGSAVAWRFGGKGGNQAVAAARMGARVAMAGRVGEDAAAGMLLAALDAAGVDRSRVRAGPGASGMSVAIMDAAGDYAAVVVSGVNRDIRAGEIDLPPGLAVLLLQNEIPEAVNAALAARAAPGTRVILNAAPARPCAPALLARTDLLVVNRIEAAAMAGTDDPAAALPVLRALGPRAVVVTLGAEGLLADDGTPLRLPGHPVPVASTHGAGDMFCGALAACLAAGDAFAEALAAAQSAAAALVATPPDARDRLTAAALRAFQSR